jgi:ribonuclease P protein component
LAGSDRGFPRCDRLLTADDYRQLFRQPQKSVDSCFTVLYKRGETGHPRLGLAVAKKNSKRAVDRNRIKRIIRESFRHHRNDLDSADIVVLSRMSTAQKSNRELQDALKKHWHTISTHL